MEAIYNRGDYLLKFGEYQRALEDGENCLKITTSASAYDLKGHAYLGLNKFDDAISVFEEIKN